MRTRSLSAGLLLAVCLSLVAHTASRADPTTPARVPYTGTIHHIFFHSLVVYPAMAFRGDPQSEQFKAFMITRDQFERILEQLHARNFILVHQSSIFSVATNGKVARAPLELPPGKVPLVISLDDISYYPYMSGRGFASRLVLDKDRKVATEIVTPSGATEVTRTGDVVPILDDFVARHPDFSLDGAKGLIALTGFQGILGYRTQAGNTAGRAVEQAAVRPVIEQLKRSGWTFASHSYSHQAGFRLNTISVEGLESDIARWRNEVEPLVGRTDTFVGPFGQTFTVDDPRRHALLRAGFRMLNGVSMKPVLKVHSTHVELDRANIDGYRIDTGAHHLAPYFDVAAIGGRGEGVYARALTARALLPFGAPTQLGPAQVAAPAPSAVAGWTSRFFEK